MSRRRSGLHCPTVQWLGDKIFLKAINPINKSRSSYEGFKFGEINAFIGDYVLVSNADANEPDTLEGCDVARIDHLFEYDKGDKYRANVQWYSRPQNLPKNINTNHLDHQREVIEEHRKYDSNISIETIFGKCTLIYGREDESPQEVLRRVQKKRPAYFCRYKLIRKQRKFVLEPVNIAEEISTSCETSSTSDYYEIAKRDENNPNSFSVDSDFNVIWDSTPRKTMQAKRFNGGTPSENSRVKSKENKKFISEDSSEYMRSKLPKSGTPLKSNNANLLQSKNDRSSVTEQSKNRLSNDGSETVKSTPEKAFSNMSIGKRKTRSTSEESLEPRSRSISPEILYQGPLSAYTILENKGQTLILKTPISITKRRLNKCTEADISNILESDSDGDREIVKMKKNDGKVVAVSKSNREELELVNTPTKIRARALKNDSNDTRDDSPRGARRNLSNSLNSGSKKEILHDLLHKQIAQKREEASLKIKLRRSTEQSNYKIDSDTDCESHGRNNLYDSPRTSSRTRSKTTTVHGGRHDTKDSSNYEEDSEDSSRSTSSSSANVQLRRSTRIRSPNKKYIDFHDNQDTGNSETRKHSAIETIRISDDSEHSIVAADSLTTPKACAFKCARLSEAVTPKSNKRETPKRNSTARKSMAVTATPKSTPRKNAKRNERVENVRNLRRIDEHDSDSDDSCTAKIRKTPRKSRKVATDCASTPSRKRAVGKDKDDAVTPLKESERSSALLRTPKAIRNGCLTPSMRQRNASIVKPSTPLQEARVRLHVSAVPKSLPCREEEFNNIYTFLEGKLISNSGGCIYISGVPGTGKTATVNEVVRCLKKTVSKGDLEDFEYIEINGMKLTEPRQAYVQILKQLAHKTATWEQAHQLLEKRFTRPAPGRRMTLLLVDELDVICNKRQDVVYNLLDWPAKASAQLVVITIANTMDLPERVLMGRVTSRLGLTRLTFQPYNHKQLQEIVIARLKDSDAFKGEAVQLVARKVAAVSGDARRALDICRRATEIAEFHDEEIVAMSHVNQALTEMIASAKVQAIKHCSEAEQIFLQAVCAEISRTGVEEACLKNVYRQLESLCSLEGIKVPAMTQVLDICGRLGSSRLLICEHSRNDIYQRILLNVSSDDIHFAVQDINV